VTYSRPPSKRIREMALRPKCSISTFYLTLSLELCRLTNHHKIHESRRAANILKCTGNLYLLKVNSLSCVRLFETLRTVAYQALPSVGFSRQQYWSGVPLPSPFKCTWNTKIGYMLDHKGFLGGSVGKNPPVMQETLV
jgi:hypothetical protein